MAVYKKNWILNLESVWEINCKMLVPKAKIIILYLFLFKHILLLKKQDKFFYQKKPQQKTV